MRILVLCQGDAETNDSWSGVTHSVVQHLRRAGHTVICADVELAGVDRSLAAALSVARPRRRWWVRFHLGRWGFLLRSRRAARQVARHGAAVDLILQIGATFRVDPRGRPLVLYCDSNIALSCRGIASGFSEAAMLTPAEIHAIRRREAGVLAGADLIFTMSDLVKRSFERDFGVAPQRLATIHCAPNEEIVREDTAPARGAAPAPVILFSGRDFGRKGGELLLEAFREVRRELPEARLVMVGPRAPVPVPPGVEFPGFLDRDRADGRAAMDRAYREATVFCVPTRFEPFGTAFVEAMTYGLPCVGPRAWAVPEIIAHGETGLLVPPEDPQALAAALLTLLRDPARARAMGEAGRRRALERFTWTAAIDRMLTRLEPLVRGPRPPARRSA